MKKVSMRGIVATLSVFVWTLWCSAANVALDLRPSAAGRLQHVSASQILPEDTVRQHRLSVGSARVGGLAVGDRLDLQLFDDRRLEIDLVEETAALSGRAFLGRAADGLGLLDCVVLETEHGLVVDVTDSVNRRVWQIVSGEDGVQVREARPTERSQIPAEPSALPETEEGEVPVIDIGGGLATSGLPAPVRESVTALPPPVPKVSGLNESTPSIDVLVAYDTMAATWARNNGGGLEAFAETSVQKMNSAIANTGLDSKFRFRLVGTYEVGGTAGGDLSYALHCASGMSHGSTDGEAWARVPGVRDAYYADIVCVLVDTGVSYGTVGLGYSLHSGSTPASCGYNACAIRAVATGHTMTHEVGHNMGAGHSDAMADKSNCGPQYHTYSRGYYFHAGGTGYYTIMAYNTDGYGNYYTSVPYFSSPSYTFNGVAVGDSLHDNSRTLSELWSTIASNRREPTVSSEVGRGLDAESYTWTTDGTYPWFRVTDSSSDGVDSARSCEMSGTSTSWTETRVVGPARLSFSFRFRSARGSFAVTCDGSPIYSYGGGSANYYGYSWENASGLSIPSGTHVVRFAYTHASMGFTSGDGNGVWIDKVVFSGGSPAKPQCVVSFNANGGTCPTSSKTYSSGAALGTLPTATRAGYTFAGWFTSASGGTQVTATTTVTRDVTYYAHWIESLGTALSSSGLTFTTGGGASWTVATDAVHGGASSAKSGAIGDSQSSWIQTTVAGPATLSFWWKVSSESGYDKLRWYLDGIEQTYISGSAGWTQVTATLASGSHVVKWTYAKDGSVSSGSDCGWLDDVVVTPAVTVTFHANGGTCPTSSKTCPAGSTLGTLPTATRAGYTFAGWFTSASGGTQVTESTTVTGNVTYYAHWRQLETLDSALSSSGLTFTTGGGASWTVVTDTVHGGASSAKSGAIGHDQSTWIQTTVAGPATLSFWWKVSSESGYDKLRWYLDDIEQASISGSAGWTQVTATLAAGSHVVRWTYAKDGSVSSGSDCGWLDDVVVTANGGGTPSAPGPVVPSPIPAPVVPSPVPAPVVPSPVPAPVAPPPVDAPSADEIIGGYAVGKVLQVDGALLRNDEVFGVVSLKVGKAGPKGSKVSAKVTMLNGKKMSVKGGGAVNLAPAPCMLAFDVKDVGTLSLKLGSTAAGTIAFAGSLADYEVASMRVGGPVTRRAEFDFLEDFPTAVGDWEVWSDFLPYCEPVEMNGAKWRLAKGASIKFAKPTPEDEKEWIVNGGRDDPVRTNLSGLKLGYQVKTGAFKGSFRVYMQDADGVRTKKGAVAVSGFLVDGIGWGVVTFKGVGQIRILIR